MIPAEIQDHERVRMQLNAALNAMHAAMEGGPLPPAYAAYAPAAPSGTAAAAVPTGLAASRWATGMPQLLMIAHALSRDA